MKSNYSVACDQISPARAISLELGSAQIFRPWQRASYEAKLNGLASHFYVDAIGVKTRSYELAIADWVWRLATLPARDCKGHKSNPLFVDTVQQNFRRNPWSGYG